MTIVQFTILGEPVPKGRPQATGRPFPHLITPKKTRVAEANVRAQIAAQLAPGFVPLAGPLELHVTFIRAPLKSHKPGRTYPAVTKPDLDNLVKLLLDCMNSVVFLDDNQIVSLVADKCYGPAPCTYVIITTLEAME